MKFKRFTTALLAGAMLSFSTAGTCFAYSGGTTEASEAAKTMAGATVSEPEGTEADESKANAEDAGMSKIEAADESAATTETKEATDTADAAESSTGEASDAATSESVPYDIIANADGTYTFRFDDYEWSYDPNEELESETIGTVTGVNSYLHLRSGAGLDYEIIGHLLPCAQVDVVGEEGDWYKVTIPEQTGYVYSDYLNVAEQAASDDSGMNEELLSMLLAMMVQSRQQVSTGRAGLTPDGNLTLVDDIGSTTGTGQQFITLVTKNGNTFYLVIDRDDDGNENVHFMNLVDEADLFALLDEDAQSEYTEAHQSTEVAESEETKTDDEETEAETEVKTEKENNWAPLMLLAIAAVGGIGYAGYRYINKKKKAEAADKPDPDADYQDEGDEEYDIPEEDDYEEDEPDDDEEEYPEESAIEDNQTDDDSNE